MLEQSEGAEACRNCGNNIFPDAAVGSGRVSDGVFCHLDCYVAFNQTDLAARARALRASSN